MKVGLIGFGKAGKAVANVILQNNFFSLEWIIKNTPVKKGLTAVDLLGINSSDSAVIFSKDNLDVGELLNEHPVDIIVDFSNADGIYQYGEIAADNGIKIISAISHYETGEIEFLKTLSQKTTVFWSPNITLGVNYLLFAASMLKNISPGADIEVIEEHFKTKSGISGTALKIAEVLDVETESINSVRAGGIVGRHEVIFGFPYQTVRLVHESISREAFGNGALFVAENIKDKKNGFFNFEDILRPYFFHESAILS